MFNFKGKYQREKKGPSDLQSYFIDTGKSHTAGRQSTRREDSDLVETLVIPLEERGKITSHHRVSRGVKRLLFKETSKMWQW